MTKTDDLLPIGLEDRLPAEARSLIEAMRCALEAMDSHGYDRVSPPLVEFEQSLAGRMDGLGTRRQFRFVDPASLRTLALRSDITPQIGRIASTGLASAPRPLRLCYGGDVATMVADQLAPARQRTQMGAELIGADTIAAASEIVLLALDAVEATGATGLSVDFTLPDLVDTLSKDVFPLEAGRVDAVRRELDTKDAGGLVSAGGGAYLPLIHAAGPFADAIDKLKNTDAGGALASRIEGLEAIAASVGDRARITLDPTERHGFEYQSWFGFTLYAEGSRKALGRGGTYRIGGTGEAATGFSLYLDALLSALPAAETRPLVFLPVDHDRDAARKVRSEGWRTVAALSDGDNPQKLGCTHRLSGDEVQPL
ncbi:ATP phosphoribosyltransferase regulatory subunit [Altererythrobacter sp. MTPC7]|uniref:ATP phosphoribosyltransferase regulatory subunit n=1 Tax=Altererythrobacter sp. MTPC7 TaxID=3056567 RepID=UPI0036F3811D